ncbi:MAG TPA: hypothetical protein VHM20_04375, partial [Gammaproteobacteria bacterium]|nr:hypothetical protein [Gammaproteobacteria bacterium]
FNELQDNLNIYSNSLEIMMMHQILTKDLKLDFNELVIDFLKNRGVKFNSRSEINKFIEKEGIKLLEYSAAIYIEQEARLNNLYFLTKKIANDLHSLLNTIEKTGPLVFNYPNNILHTIKETYVKSYLNFPIYDLLFEDAPTKGPTHAMLLVGGAKDRHMNEFVYLINPNNSYSANKKTPVYRISFEKFKTNLLSFSNGNKNFAHPTTGQVYSLTKNFFIYGKYGSNSTRNPIPPDPVQINAFRLK